MARLTITCLSRELRRTLLDKTSDRRLDSVPTCESGITIGFETIGKPRKSRPISAYNQFISRCIRERPKDTPIRDSMRACAAQWRRRS